MDLPICFRHKPTQLGSTTTRTTKSACLIRSTRRRFKPRIRPTPSTEVSHSTLKDSARSRGSRNLISTVAIGGADPQLATTMARRRPSLTSTSRRSRAWASSKRRFRSRYPSHTELITTRSFVFFDATNVCGTSYDASVFPGQIPLFLDRLVAAHNAGSSNLGAMFWAGTQSDGNCANTGADDVPNYIWNT